MNSDDVTGAFIASMATWIAELEQAQRTGQYEHAIAHTVASMQTAVECLRHLAKTDAARHEDD
jgi:hypothetical protein